MALFRLNDLDPIQGLLDLQRELDRFFRSPVGLDLGPSGFGVFPAINVFGDEEGSIVVRAEVPGVDPADIDIAIEDRVLTLSGERRTPERAKGSHHRRERHFGKFSRSVQLPRDLDSERAAADCRNGILTLTIPKAARAERRRVDIAAA